jgi:hypothetical protein
MDVKLIDFLVQNGRDGWKWPNGIAKAVALEGGRSVSFFYNDSLPPALSETLIAPRNFAQHECVTNKQYEAALAASKAEWDGEGVPPVGADVQCICNQFPSEGQEKLLGKILYSGEYTILHTYKTNEQHHVPVESVLMTKHWSITPIRSEADKKREIGVLSLARTDPTVGRFEYGEKMSDGKLIGYAWYELYDKIAAGEVAGIRID